MVNLVVNGSVIEGRNASNLLMFTISVATDGTVTLDQRVLSHTRPTVGRMRKYRWRPMISSP
ncbi:hypothetical protein AJ88_11115 [Mesorhizobium amorphae CCBAU 01583]|nr:hypothetical protein AJ88_11115 [Mesorhizobium amorphae CCBAU 01583]